MEKPCLIESVGKIEKDTTEDGKVSLWCKSVTPKKSQTSLQQIDHNTATCSPTDFQRYKTNIILQGEKEEWETVWRLLRRSLQSGQLEYCNAYSTQFPSHIAIYHYGWQQAMVGEWIWKNVKTEYSKNTQLIPVDTEV